MDNLHLKQGSTLLTRACTIDQMKLMCVSVALPSDPYRVCLFFLLLLLSMEKREMALVSVLPSSSQMCIAIGQTPTCGHKLEYLGLDGWWETDADVISEIFFYFMSMKYGAWAWSLVMRSLEKGQGYQLIWHVYFAPTCAHQHSRSHLSYLLTPG